MTQVGSFRASTLSGGYDRLICVFDDALVQMRPPSLLELIDFVAPLSFGTDYYGMEHLGDYRVRGHSGTRELTDGSRCRLKDTPLVGL